MMKIEEIKNPELKNHINMAYLHGENQNQDGIEKTENSNKKGCGGAKYEY